MSHIFNDTVRGREHLERAMKLSNRVTERERLIIQLNYHSALDHTDDAIRIYREYLSKWPDDVRQRYNFGNVLRDNDRIDEAIEQYRHVIRIQPDHASSYVNLATCFKSQGKFKEAVDSWQKAFALEPTWVTSGNLNNEYGVTLVAAGDTAKAREVFDRAIKDKTLQAMGLRSAALLDMYEGKYRLAQSKLEEAIVVNKAARAALNEARNHVFLAITLAGRGDRAGALRELDASFKLRDPKSPQAWLWARVGGMYAGLGALPKADTVLEVVRAETAADSAKQRATLHWLEAEIDLAKGKAADGLEKLQVADKESHSAVTLEALARAHRAAGDRVRAAEAYEALVKNLGEDCVGWEIQQACLAGKYELAALYQTDKQPDKARRQLDELLALWQGGDEDLPLLKSAKDLRKRVGD
jgi:tetratricopeptide (TPR) repeat protein